MRQCDCCREPNGEILRCQHENVCNVGERGRDDIGILSFFFRQRVSQAELATIIIIIIIIITHSSGSPG